ncbi:hypothetical protein J6590_070495 [Homalodisca vitripennis]|nr:hypothetical protein J6590_070495 [Homalodisca vitripennis]
MATASSFGCTSFDGTFDPKSFSLTAVFSRRADTTVLTSRRGGSRQAVSPLGTGLWDIRPY